MFLRNTSRCSVPPECQSLSTTSSKRFLAFIFSGFYSTPPTPCWLLAAASTFPGNASEESMAAADSGENETNFRSCRNSSPRFLSSFVRMSFCLSHCGFVHGCVCARADECVWRADSTPTCQCTRWPLRTGRSHMPMSCRKSLLSPTVCG